MPALNWHGHPSPHLRQRRGDPKTLFDAFCEAGYAHSAFEIGREAFRRTSLPLCVYVPMFATIRPHVPAEVEDDAFPPETMCGPVPSWTLDMFTREGRTALKRFLAKPSETATWIKAHIPPAQQIDFLGYILFAVEGGLLKDRYRWPVTEELRRMAEIESQGPYCPDATEIISLLRSDLPLLNEERSHVL